VKEMVVNYIFEGVYSTLGDIWLNRSA